MIAFTPTLGAEPAAIIDPQSIVDLAEAAKKSVAVGRAVVPNGGGTGQDYGYPVRAESFAVVNTSRLNRVVAVEPGDLTITVEAGATLAQVQDALRPHGLFLPIDVPHPERATVGGILATNAFGASRLGYGTARDWCIGLSVVGANGAVTKSGGKVVKNVTGYDLPKLHIGALGSLGIIAEATFKASPMPEAERTVLVQLGNDSVGGVGTYIRDALNTVSPTRFYGRRDNTGTYFVAHFTGFAEAVESEAEHCAAIARANVSERRTVSVMEEATTHETPTGAVVLQAVGVLEEQWQAFFQTTMCGENAVSETWYGTGVTRICFADAMATEGLGTLRELVETPDYPCFNDYSLLHAPLALRQGDFPVWYPEPASLPLMRRIKKALDPGGVFNPGRFVGRI
ncbi:MAG: FAD-binding oxidoreductase [Armatimonadetes bacterium]|nr:FAD-binding oxidoreductase [Armatimonadota bacterium]